MSVKIFTGEDRVKAQEEIRRLLGADYEVVEGAEIEANMLPSVMMGVSLFAEQRKIVIKDLSANEEAWVHLVDYLETPHEVVVWETKLDKRSAVYKALAKAGVEVKEFKLAEKVDFRKVFDIYDVARRDGARAVKMLEEIQEAEEPYMFVGLLTTQALKGFAGRPSEKRIIKELAELDIKMKTSTVDPWMLVKSFLIRLSSL